MSKAKIGQFSPKKAVVTRGTLGKSKQNLLGYLTNQRRKRKIAEPVTSEVGEVQVICCLLLVN